MFWNDPNLYSVAFKDLPNVPPPIWGSIPRFFNPHFNFTPYANPMPFTPQINPFLYTPQLPWLERTMTPYGYNVPQFPYFQGYRPFGL